MDMKDFPKKLYLIDDGYYHDTLNGKSYEQNFKNVAIKERPNFDGDDQTIWCRVWKDSEERDTKIAHILTNSIEMADIGNQICAWVTALDHTHGISDDMIAKLVKTFRTLANPKV